MQFKIDENLPVELAELLSHSGYDVKTVNDQGLQGVTDSTLINVCKNEKRVLITLDTDFSDIRTYPPEENAGIIVVRVTRHDKPHIIEVLRRAMPLLDHEPLEKHLWIIEESKVRIRGKDDE